uniref:Integrase catalytic domain-containing protein n=1 Tax=Anopheles quadriannulatus TaxID=34691 RepID=A0A182XQ47_ANOQN
MTVISELRRRYWIPCLLRTYRQLRKACPTCRNREATPNPPMMSHLPDPRLALGQRPFTYTGVDYFGPLLVAVGRRVEKRWGVIFTCLTVRAVHLEVAHTLSTGSCIAAVRRFIARRGVPREIISDCGTNFVGTARELRDAIAGVDHEALMTEFCSPELKWTFNPPGAPHFGGCWERLVRSVKKVLGHLNLPRRPTDEVLETALAEIELILNSRPL